MRKHKHHSIVLALTLLLPFLIDAQVCKQRSFQGFYIASLGTVYHIQSHPGICGEAGFTPPSSHFVFTIKSTIWTETIKYETLKAEELVTTENDFTHSTFILKSYFVPNAYTSIPEKWAFGGGAGLKISEFSKSAEPVVDLSMGYLIRLKSRSCSSQFGFFRLESGTLMTAHIIKPYFSLNMFLVL
jgi:hypothetical protein